MMASINTCPTDSNKFGQWVLGEFIGISVLARVGVAPWTSLPGSQVDRRLVAGLADAGKHRRYIQKMDKNPVK